MGMWDARCPVCHSWVWTTKDGTKTVPHIVARVTGSRNQDWEPEWCAGSGQEVMPSGRQD